MARAPASHAHEPSLRKATRLPGSSEGEWLPREPTGGTVAVSPDPSWRLDLPWLGLAVGLCTLHFWFLTVPSLSYHQLAPAFFTDSPFFARFVRVPGGLLSYGAAAVAQLNFRDGLGALALGVLLAGLCLSTWRLLLRVRAVNPGLGAFAVAVSMGMLPGRYVAGAELTALGLLVTSLAANAWDVSASRFKPLRYGAQWLFASLVFYVSGAAGMVGFCVLALLVDLGTGEPWRRALVWATTPLLLVAWRSWHPGWSFVAPFGNTAGDGVSLGLTLTGWLVTPMWIVGSWLVNWRRFRMPRPGRKTWLMASGLAGLLLWTSLDPERKGAAQVALFASRGQWERALEAARQVDDPSPGTRLHAARALFRSGRLLDDLFSLPQRRGRGLLPGYEAGLEMSFPLALTLLDLGQVNLAEHMAHEAFELQGPRPEMLQLLAKVNFLLGRPEAARVFLNRLRLAPLRRVEADAALRHLEALQRGVKDESLEAIRAQMPRTDEAQVQLPAELLLQQLVEANPANRMAVEYQLADALLERDPQSLAGRSALLTRLITTPGRHCEEARLAIQALWKPEAGPGPGETVGNATRERYRAFLSAREQLDRQGNRDHAALAAEFGDTYWYYLLTGRSDRRASRAPPL